MARAPSGKNLGRENLPSRKSRVKLATASERGGSPLARAPSGKKLLAGENA